ncbi:MAG: hypothetical protein ACJ761_03540 [Chloroflexota bacterium]
MTVTATTRGVTLAALMAALARPAWWVLALAGFLVRGGIVLFLVSIVTLPSPLTLSVIFGPVVTQIYFGRVEPATAILIGFAIAAGVLWLLAGTWFAAATEVVLVRDAHVVASDEGLPIGRPEPDGRHLVTRAACAHLLALVPFLIVLAFGSMAIIDETIRELLNPSDGSPVALRVLAGSVLPLVVIGVTWLLAEIVGGLAVRRVVLLDEPVFGAVGRASLDLVRRPIGALAAPLVTTVVLAFDLVAVLLVVTIVWNDVRDRLIQPLVDPVSTALGLATFAGAWLLALVVTGLIAAWRSAAMSLETDRAAIAAGA